MFATQNPLQTDSVIASHKLFKKQNHSQASNESIADLKKLADRGKNSRPSAKLTGGSAAGTASHSLIKLKKALHPTVINRSNMKRKRAAFISQHRYATPSRSESENKQSTLDLNETFKVARRPLR